MKRSWKSTSALAAVAAAMLVIGTHTAQAGACNLAGGYGGTCTFNSAIFTNPDNDVNVGTGLINPFLSIQKKGVEEGFNTDGALPLDTKRPEFTNALLVSDVGIVNIAGTNYLEFLLDLNEPNNNNQQFIKLQEFKIYTGGSAAATATDLSGLTLRYDMDAGDTSNEVQMDGNLFPGSGIGVDLYTFVPASIFAGLGSQNLVLYVKFGDADDTNPYTSEGGFEEYFTNDGNLSTCWNTTPDCGGGPGNEIPEPGSLALLGLGVLGFGLSRRKARK